MIEESLLKSSFIGKDGFVWWIGQVADPKVWRDEKSRVDGKLDSNKKEDSWAYRVKVRIIGYHSFDSNILPDNDLPWAHVLTSAADGAPGQGGFGKIPMLVGGESVLGFFLDGEEGQQPVIMSCFYRTQAVQNAKEPGPFKPFTGMKGNFKTGSTRQYAGQSGTVNQVNQNTVDSGSAFTMQSNPQFGVAEIGSLDVSPDFSPLTPNTQNIAGSNFSYEGAVVDQLFMEDASLLSFFKPFKDAGPITGSNGCGDNILSQLTNTLQSFIGLVNGLEKTALGFIDPIQNTIVDIGQIIKKVSRSIASIMKLIINGMRDMMMKLVGNFFRDLIALIIPKPQQLPVSEAGKEILNIIFCLFEKLFGPLLDFIAGLLGGMLGKSPNIPRCAAEEVAGSLIQKLADIIDGTLATVLSGLDWLAGGISSITGALRGSVNILNQLLSFLDCDSLQCQGTSEYDPFSGIKFASADNWSNAIGTIDILNGFGSNIDDTIGYLSIFGSADTPFRDCRSRIINPLTQSDLGPLPLGVRFYNCVPPEIIISGDGVGARATAVVSSSDGSLLTIRVDDPGRGYTYPPKVTVVDNSNYGAGAEATSVINSNGNISAIYLRSSGSGYCQTNLSIDTTDTTNIAAGTTSSQTSEQRLTASQIIGISTVTVGIVTNVIVERPGVGYTSGDAILIGNCMYGPILSRNGSIIGVTSANYCSTEFKSVPPVVINTNTGEGAELYPVIQYVPQYVVDNPELRSGIGTDEIKSVVQCV